MATNPMQRKARNSFLLGMVITLLITGTIIGLLVYSLIQIKKKEAEELAASVKVCVLKQDVKSGQVLTEDMFTQQTLNKSLVPENATSNFTSLTDFSLVDKEGNLIYTDKDGLYMQNGNSKVRIYQEDETDAYYTQSNNEKKYIELNTVPLVAKVDMKSNTVITSDLISRSDSIVTDDVRKEEYNMLILPMDLATGDYIDIRLMLPSGQNYIVISKKEVEIPVVGAGDSIDTIWVDLTEDEILTMSSAIVDAYRVTGAKLYVTKYTDAGIQAAAQPTYIVTAETLALMQKDPNILETAKNSLFSRYNENAELRNDYINRAINAEEDAESNLQTKMQESITNSKESRQEYLQGLTSTE